MMARGGTGDDDDFGRSMMEVRMEKMQGHKDQQAMI